MLNSVTNLSISLQNPKPIIGKSTPQGTALSFTAIFDSACLIWEAWWDGREQKVGEDVF